MFITRQPRPILRPFVKTIWAIDETDELPQVAERERVLPTANMHIVFRLSQPLRLFTGADDATGEVIGLAVVGGARSSPYLRDVSTPSMSVGAELLPGASEVLFRESAVDLARRHTPLDDLFGNLAHEMHERFLALDSLEQRLELLELFLANRLPRVHGLHPAVAHALESFSTTDDVREVVRDTGYSHRRFIVLFERAVGLTPKLYCRVRRFQRVLERATAQQTSWVDLALDEGYSDQSHLVRQFREFAGMSPSEYQRLSPTSPNHVPVIQRLKDEG